MGTAVFGGMLLATFLSLAVVPVFFVLIERIRERFRGGPPHRPSGAPESTHSPS
ncbi:MAG TPA: hypothetical protein VKF60_03410 [Myxococcota bacterium]|nr:hypothetical protein [Myxococcota bacterium]